MDRLIGFWLELTVLLQALLLAADAPMSRAQLMQFFLGAVCLILLVVYPWRSRLCLNSHADMLLIMFTSGGLGMLAGMSSHMSHATDFIVWCPMCLGMFVLGLAPPDCLQPVRALCPPARILGKSAADRFFRDARRHVAFHLRKIEHGEWMMISRHFTMPAGMMLGMAAGMWVRSLVLFPTSPQTRRDLTNDTSEACLRAGRTR